MSPIAVEGGSTQPDTAVMGLTSSGRSRAGEATRWDDQPRALPGSSGYAFVWVSSRPALRLTGSSGSVGSVAFSPDGRILAISEGDGRALTGVSFPSAV